jgi:hypothetical protein
LLAAHECLAIDTLGLMLVVRSATKPNVGHGGLPATSKWLDMIEFEPAAPLTARDLKRVSAASLSYRLLRDVWREGRWHLLVSRNRRI